MAKKATKSAKSVKEKAIDAALSLAAEKGWAETGLADISAKAKVPLAELRDHFEDRTDILAAYGRAIDRKVLENAGAPDPDVSPRDRLFDISMERFDALNEQREGVRAILKSFCHDPKQAVIGLPHLGRSMNWMLEAAGIDTGGVRGGLRIAGLTGVYLKTLKSWMDDDSPDMSKTMAALDKNLGQAEKLAETLGV